LGGLNAALLPTSAKSHTNLAYFSEKTDLFCKKNHKENHSESLVFLRGNAKSK
jgi:hypothetical protein